MSVIVGVLDGALFGVFDCVLFSGALLGLGVGGATDALLGAFIGALE